MEVVHGLFMIGVHLQGTASLIENELVARRIDDFVMDLDEFIRALRSYMVDLASPGGL